MLEIVYQLPYPPSVNHIYSRTRRGGVMLNPKARAYRDEVIMQIGKGHTTLKGPLSMQVDLYMPDKRKRDIDNPMKSLCDSLTHAGVYDDDSQIQRLLIQRIGIDAPGKAIVSIRQI